MENTPLVLSIGLSVKQGYSFIWLHGKQPCLIRPDVFILPLEVKGDTPYLRRKTRYKHDGVQDRAVDLCGVSQVDGASWERDAALGGQGGRKRGGLRRPPLLRGLLLLLRQGLLLPRGPKPMQELPLERPGRGLRGRGRVDVEKLRGRHGARRAAAGGCGAARGVGTSLCRNAVSALGLRLPGPVRPAVP